MWRLGGGGDRKVLFEEEVGGEAGDTSADDEYFHSRGKRDGRESRMSIKLTYVENVA
jgi:hypothetical protein